MSNPEYCIGCGTTLSEVLDSDPNGEMNSVCAKCEAEEAHDFDLEPAVEFDRSGSIVEVVLKSCTYTAVSAFHWDSKLTEDRKQELVSWVNSLTAEEQDMLETLLGDARDQVEWFREDRSW